MQVKRAIAHYIAPGSHTSLTTAKAREALYFEHGRISAFLYGDVSNKERKCMQGRKYNCNRKVIEQTRGGGSECTHGEVAIKLEQGD